MGWFKHFLIPGKVSVVVRAKGIQELKEDVSWWTGFVGVVWDERATRGRRFGREGVRGSGSGGTQ